MLLAALNNRHVKLSTLLCAVCLSLPNRYAVLIEQPLYMDFLAQFMGFEHDAVWMKWRPQEGTRLHLVTLDGSKVSEARFVSCICSAA